AFIRGRFRGFEPGGVARLRYAKPPATPNPPASPNATRGTHKTLSASRRSPTPGETQPIAAARSWGCSAPALRQGPATPNPPVSPNAIRSTHQTLSARPIAARAARQPQEPQPAARSPQPV